MCSYYCKVIIEMFRQHALQGELAWRAVASCLTKAGQCLASIALTLVFGIQ